MGKKCPLCERKIIHEVFYEDKTIWITLCKSCFVPMVVLKRHTMEATDEERAHMTEELYKVGHKFYAGDSFIIDTKQRKIKDHIHWHARRKLNE